MRKIALITLTALPLFAGFFPQTIHTSISNIDKKSLTLSSAFPVNGMSGVIVHNYGNEVEAVTARVVQNNTNDVQLVPNDIIKHNKLPSINTEAIVGDKVIGGYLYNHVLVLAPDSKTYADIVSNDNKNWIHPDLYALFLASYGDNVPNKKNLKSFAKKYQVGLIYIVSHGTAKLLDPISGKIVSQKPIANLPAKGETPFFMRFNKIDSGLFSKDNTKSYYQIMDKL
jgi:hypothetical protein